jgi:TonB family protein
MVKSQWIFLLTTAIACAFATHLLAVGAAAQARLSYPELNTALQVKIPNQSFKTRTDLINWLIGQVKSRKIDKPLTRDREDDLRQAGATDDLISIIKANSPELPKPAQDTVVDLGELASRATSLVKPEYTNEARQAGINGSIVLQLSLDEQGRVTSTKTLSGLSNGLTENAIAAAKSSTFTPAAVNGKPAKGVGTITYNFKIAKVDIPSTLALGDDYRTKSNCNAAITEYTRVINVDAKQTKALAGRGICYVVNKELDNAIADLGSAVASGQADDQTYFYLGLAYDFKGEPKPAMENYDQALRSNRELDKWPLMNCAYVDRRQVPQNELRNYGDEIVKACTTSLSSALDFLRPLIYLKRGIGDRLKADFDRSISDLDAARQLAPRFGAVQTQLQISYNARGLAHFDKKEYKEAVDDITAAINLNPQNPTPFVNRCAVNVYGLKNYDEAINDCSAAIRLNDRATMAYNHRGYAYEMKKDVTHAIADYKKALDVDPRNEAAHANLDRAQKGGKPSLKN